MDGLRAEAGFRGREERRRAPDGRRADFRQNSAPEEGMAAEVVSWQYARGYARRDAPQYF